MDSKAELIAKRKLNIRLFPIYKAISWDLLFYYSISFLFLTQTKGISAALVLFADGFYPIFKMLFQIPSTSFIQQIGKKKAMMIGNILVALSVLATILANNVAFLILANLFSASGYVLKGLCEDTLLYDSISRSPKRNTIFSRISGKGAAFYYYIDAIFAIISGFLFVINGYLPMFLCLFFCLIATFLTTRFVETHPSAVVKKKKNLLKENLLDLKEGFSFIFRSNRLRSLILYSALFNTTLAILVTLRSSILKDMQMPEQYFGIIFAILGIISGITSQNANWFHCRFRNRTLKVFSLSVCFSMIVGGLCVICGLNTSICIEILLLTFLISYSIKGPFYILIKRYLNSFSTSSMRVKISSASDFTYGIIRAIVTFFASALLGITSTAYVLAILGCIFTVLFILLLDYMKHTVGLQPDEYSKKEIEFTEIH